MGDISIQCVECGRSFVWSSGEQEFFCEHGLQPPKHCKACLAHRHVEQDGGNRGLSGSPGKPLAFKADAESSPTEERSAPLVSLPLWRSLRHSHEMRLISQFVHLDPTTASALDRETLSLLMQWMFEQFERETFSAETQLSSLDLRLRDSAKQQVEFARLYYDRENGLLDSLYDLYDGLAGQRIDRIYLCTFFAFTDHQHEVGGQLPIALDFLEGQALCTHLQEAQQRFRARLERARPMAAPSTVAYREMPVPGEISGQARPYYAKTTPW